MRSRATIVLALAAFLPLRAATLAERIEALIDSTPVTRAAFWGIEVREIGSRRVVYRLNAERLFIPASNVKLFTTALALTRLGPGYRSETAVLAPAAPDGDGRIAELRIAGGGDPNLSGRAIPYDKDAPAGDPLRVVGNLAARVVERGVREVTGDVVGDDTAFVWEPYADGWGAEDLVNDDGPAVSALSLHDNVVAVRVSPGASPGAPAIVSLQPPLEYYWIDNRAVTGGRGARLRMVREPGSRQLRISGAIPQSGPPMRTLVAIDDPALYTAMALREALEDRGVKVGGAAVALHRHENESEKRPVAGWLTLAKHTSAPLVESLRVIDKVSQNLHAELALRSVGLARRGEGTKEAGLAEMREFLKSADIAPSEYGFRDGSGLSWLNLVTPGAIVNLLDYMQRSRHAQKWRELLPLAGEDGTLEKRFSNTAAHGRLLAKTGTLSHASALSGYVDRKDGRVWAFSILVNNYDSGALEVRAVIDKIGTLLAE